MLLLLLSLSSTQLPTLEELTDVLVCFRRQAFGQDVGALLVRGYFLQPKRGLINVRLEPMVFDAYVLGSRR